MATARTLSLSQARRVALAAQGFATAKPARVGVRQIEATFERLQLLQLDSVNVFERSHYLPVLARLGAYDKRLLDRLTLDAPPGRPYAFEYWAHQAALLPVQSLPLMRWRMRELRSKALGDAGSWANANAAMLGWLREELAAKGPLAASAIEHEANRRAGPWWGWSDVKIGLETLFRWGEVFSAGRSRFERRYGLAEQVLPAGAADHDMPEADAVRELTRRAAVALGVATADDLADYFRLRNAQTLPAIRDLEEAGELTRVAVDSWSKPAWMHRDARLPRQLQAAALLSPFDPVVWYRPRTERLFGFHYRIEIYTPADKRIFGYYTLPLLLGERLVGRIDLKSDRQAGVLRVQSAWSEPLAPADTAERAAPLLFEAAAWQGLQAIEVAPRGDLAPRLAQVVAAR